MDGTADEAVKAALERALVVIGDQVSSDVHTVLNARIQHPTPYYETQIIAQMLGGSMVVHDRDIVYGPWLEGVSQRNATTSFKGYHAFETARDNVQKTATATADRIITETLKGLE